VCAEVTVDYDSGIARIPPATGGTDMIIIKHMRV
jgi:Mrp family chromosome partitioning ATPase